MGVNVDWAVEVQYVFLLGALTDIVCFATRREWTTCSAFNEDKLEDCGNYVLHLFHDDHDKNNALR